MERVLTATEAKALYDRIGAKQETQAFYEDRPLTLLVAHADFSDARTICEFGCGTGRFAVRLLSNLLPRDVRYQGVDISPTMVRIARERLSTWPERATVHVSDGAIRLPVADGSCDRVICTYVLDLLSMDDIAAFLTDARRALTADGSLCVVNLTDGRRGLARFVSALWRRVHAFRPQLVGGCRPIRLRDALAPADWGVLFYDAISAFAITSEIVVAKPVRAM
jgi:SAM-dependent methyltransferase